MKNTILSSLNTIDGETLMNRPLQPLSFVVDTLISQGLHILAGSPKVGKSWLALWLAVTVAKGEPVWGMQVKQGTRTAGSPSSPAWSRRATRSSGQTPGSTSPSSVQTDGSAGTGVSMMRHFSKRTWRQTVGFRPGSVEPDEGWLGEMANGIIQLGRSMERLDDIPPLPAPPTWTDSKQRRREALKKLAMGQKLTCDTHSQGMSM